MLCVEDYLDALQWADNIGGLAALCRRSEDNLAVIARWVERTPWIGFLAEHAEICSNTSICLRLTDADIIAQGEEFQERIIKKMVSLLEEENVALDIKRVSKRPRGFAYLGWCNG